MTGSVVGGDALYHEVWLFKTLARLEVWLFKTLARLEVWMFKTLARLEVWMFKTLARLEVWMFKTLARLEDLAEVLRPPALCCSMAKQRVLGIDPGSRKTGWGVVDVAGNVMTHVDNGVLILDDDKDLTIRLVDLAHRLNDVITTYRPDRAAVEDVFVQKSARSALILGQARGAALTTLGLRGLAVASFPTSVVKQRVSGRGGAGKEQVAAMVTALLGLPEHPFEDAADALAVALCACLESPWPTAAAALPPRKGPRQRGRDALAALARAQGKIT